jgi:hypothetical protein
MKSTHLDLLTREGVLSVKFTPELDQEHYAELVDIVVNSADGTQQLSDAIRQAANRWDRLVMID